VTLLHTPCDLRRHSVSRTFLETHANMLHSSIYPVTCDGTWYRGNITMQPQSVSRGRDWDRELPLSTDPAVAQIRRQSPKKTSIPTLRDTMAKPKPAGIAVTAAVDNQPPIVPVVVQPRRDPLPHDHGWISTPQTVRPTLASRLPQHVQTTCCATGVARSMEQSVS
jgi:hypothetical protein